MTRTDAIKAAACKMIEMHRALIDSNVPLKGLRLDMKIAADNTISDGLLSPTLDACTYATPSTNGYKF